MRRPPPWPGTSVPAAAAGSRAARLKPARAARARRRSLFMDGLQPGADRPHAFLGDDALEGRHVDAAVAGRAVADAIEEDLVPFVAARQVAQVRGDAAGDGVYAVAAG